MGTTRTAPRRSSRRRERNAFRERDEERERLTSTCPSVLFVFSSVFWCEGIARMRAVNPVLRRVTGATTNPFGLAASARRTTAQCAHRRTATDTAHACAATASAFVAGAGLSCARRGVSSRTPQRGGTLLVEANAKRCLGSTKGGTNRHRKRTSGFRVRKRSATGAKVMKNRRKKGRKQLAPASKHSGKK